MIKIVCLDPGFSSIGYARMIIPPRGSAWVEMFGVFHTFKSDKKQKVLATEDNAKRTIEIATFLRKLATGGEGRAIAIATEAMSWPRNASVSAKVGLGWGAICSLSEASGLPLMQTSPKDLKRALCGTGSATKEEVQEAVEKLYPETKTMRREIKASDWEHCFDAVAVGHVALGSDVVKMTRRAA
jgi:Holliday junction resolvasome RuvABC endonuclease subunit